MNMTMVLVGPKNRGSILAAGAVLGVIGIVILSTGGGYLYDNWSKAGPFMVAAAMLSLTTIFGVMLGICGKLKA